MTFAYSDYYKLCFLIPLFIATLSDMLLIGILTEPVEADPDRKKRIFVIVRNLIFVAVTVNLFSHGMGRLMNGGAYLLVEKPFDAIEVTGTISEIKTLNEFIMIPTKEYYDYDSGEKTSYGFTVDGIEIKSFGKGKFQEGDEVTVLYLPKSGYLLSIAWVEETDNAPPEGSP